MKPMRNVIVMLAVVGIAAIIAGCGGDDANVATTGGHTSHATAGKMDAAFITDMTAHHQGAIEMARIAQRRAEHAQVRRLADDIVAAQQGEIAEMKRVAGHMGTMGTHGSGHMGMTESQMGMDMDPEMLRDAKPFDREFIDMMIPHHRGAITMARRLLAKGSDPTLRAMARNIVRTQSAEIREMRTWRTRWYGSRSSSMSMG